MTATATVGARRHLVSLTGPGTSVPDGDGGTIETRTALDPATWYCSIEPATARDLERVGAGTVTSSATHILKGRYHAGITTQTIIAFGARTFHVAGVSNPEERGIETIVIATEVVL